MHKKLMLACMTIAAFAAFVIAPAASATTLTESGKPLAVGSSITGKSTGGLKFTGGFGIECELGHFQGTLTQNNTIGPVKWEVPVGGFTMTNVGGAACSSALGATTYKVTSKLCVETTSVDTLKFTGCGANIVIDMIAPGVTCQYEAASITGNFTTNTTPTTLTISEQPIKEVGGLFFCPDSFQWDMTLDLYTTGGFTGLTVS